jgi:hypothetical protein
MFPTSFGIRGQMILARYGEYMVDERSTVRGRPTHIRRQPRG